MSITSTVTAKVLDQLAQLPSVDVIPNPAPVAPFGLGTVTTNVISWVKWGVIIAVGIAALVGVGMIAAGRILGHQGSSKHGVQVLVSAVIGAALVGVVIPFVNNASA